MKKTLLALVLAALAGTTLSVPAGVLAASKPAPKASTTKGKTTKVKLPAKAVCVVCAAKSGKQLLEPVHSSIVYKGKTYYFCENKDKAEFISNPAKYAK